MRFICSSCHKEIGIPDNKLPSTPRFKVKCPHCQERVVLDKNSPYGENQGMAMAPDLTHEAEEQDAARESSMQVEPEIFPPGARIVFMALDSKRWIEAAQGYFSEMGYYESRASDVREAVMKLRLNDYHVLLVEDSKKYQAILAELASWPGVKRRTINVILIGDNAQSLDPQIAFRRAINTYFNIHDLDRGHELFGMALKAFDEYYRYLQMAKGELPSGAAS